MKIIFIFLLFISISLCYSPDLPDTSYMKKQFYHYLNNITKYYGNLELMKKNLDSAYTLALYLENYEAGILSDYYLQLARYYYTKGDLSQTITYYMLCIRNSKKNLEKFATNNYTSLIYLFIKYIF